MRFSRFEFLLAIPVVFLLSACQKGPGKEDLKHLQGYWEIRRVIFPDGAEKLYEINSTVDYFSWDGKTGYRKKVQPTLEGTYITSDDALPMDVVWKDRRLFLTFSGGSDAWEEEVLELKPGLLTTLHTNGLTYEYARFEPLANPKADG